MSIDDGKIGTKKGQNMTRRDGVCNGPGDGLQEVMGDSLQVVMGDSLQEVMGDSLQVAKRWSANSHEHGKAVAMRWSA